MENISNTPVCAQVSSPSYDRAKLKSRIVHIGFGAFHRAHQALFTDEVARISDSDWGICEISLFSGQDTIRQLQQQDGLFSVAEKGADQTDVKIIGVVTEAMHPKLNGIDGIIAKMAEPQVAIISMTITEKGYCIDPATGTLDLTNSLVIHDLAHPKSPKSVLGYIVQALALRREFGHEPVSIMSCDNIQENGHVARAAVIEFAQQIDSDLANWIAEHTSFPCTMVDRIVPAASPESLAEIEHKLGVYDPCAIACEPFRQWVIEDNFVAGRPEWELAGAEIVADVGPYEEMKLRMLNGSHSFLAYLGYLAGYKTIADTMQDSGFRQAALTMMLQAQAPSLNMPLDTDLQAYANRLIERFTNPSLQHQTWQIATDGSQKIPQRLCDSLRFHLKAGSDFKWIALAIAGWMRYVSGVDEQGSVIEVRDPMAAMLKEVCDSHQLSASELIASELNASVVPALLGIEAIFPQDIGSNDTVITAVTLAYQSLLKHGAKAAVSQL